MILPHPFHAVVVFTLQSLWTCDIHVKSAVRVICEISDLKELRVTSKRVFVCSLSRRLRKVGVSNAIISMVPDFELKPRWANAYVICSSRNNSIYLLEIIATRMHSSRMRTARSCSCRGGLHQAHPPGSRNPSDQIPPRAGTPVGPGTPLWYHTPPVDRILDTRFWKYYLGPKFVCGR